MERRDGVTARGVIECDFVRQRSHEDCKNWRFSRRRPSITRRSVDESRRGSVVIINTFEFESSRKEREREREGLFIIIVCMRE